MRFLQQEPEAHPYGATKTCSWFAWWPVTIGEETRWLERVCVEYVWCMGNFYMGQSDGWGMSAFK